jgi:hypothetical protein
MWFFAYLWVPVRGGAQRWERMDEEPGRGVRPAG